jgi:O-antigen ligase
MQTQSHSFPHREASPWRPGLLLFLFVCGFATVFGADFLNRAQAQVVQALLAMGLLKATCFLVLGIAAVYLLLKRAEIALALFFLIGLVKGDPRLASTPADLTVVVGSVVLLAVCIRLLSGKGELHLPREYFFYVPLLAMMVVSLTYTPEFSPGLEKLLRFLCLTGIGIVSPFVLFDSVSRMKLFFVSLAVGGFLVAINSLTMLGGQERMVSPSGLNTELGAASAVSLIIIWGLLFPQLSLLRRVLFYPLLGILVVALIGSGGRFANVSAVICVLVGAVLCRKLWGDLAIFAVLALLALPLIWIPQASYDYLGSLMHPPQAMGTRSDLLALGVKMFAEHPVFGVGLSGFKFLSPNPLTYNYPHNLILELGSEMGVVASLCFLGLAFCSFWEICKQLATPYQRQDSLAATVFLLLIYSFLDAMVSGDINDLRFMWFMFALPFVLRNFRPLIGVREVNLEVPRTVHAH